MATVPFRFGDAVRVFACGQRSTICLLRTLESRPLVLRSPMRPVRSRRADCKSSRWPTPWRARLGIRDPALNLALSSRAEFNWLRSMPICSSPGDWRDRLALALVGVWLVRSANCDLFGQPSWRPSADGRTRRTASNSVAVLASSQLGVPPPRASASVEFCDVAISIHRASW